MGQRPGGGLSMGDQALNRKSSTEAQPVSFVLNQSYALVISLPQPKIT